jgi:hypothetical protein
MVSLGIKRGKEREKEKKERGKGRICEVLPAVFGSVSVSAHQYNVKENNNNSFF